MTSIRHLRVAETRPEHFDRALADGKVSSNVFLRRIHNHALGMEWLLKSVIPRLQWPKPVFKEKRAITAEEHAAIMLREQNAERRDFYELLWHTGAAQSDGACLRADAHENWRYDGPAQPSDERCLALRHNVIETRHYRPQLIQQDRQALPKPVHVLEYVRLPLKPVPVLVILEQEELLEALTSNAGKVHGLEIPAVVFHRGLVFRFVRLGCQPF